MIGAARDGIFHRDVFHARLKAMGQDGESSAYVLDELPLVFSIEELEAHPELLAKQRVNIAYFRAGLKKLGYRPLEGDSAIIPIIVGGTSFAITMSDLLLKEGVFVTGFGFPVVPEGKARIRVQMSAALETSHLDRALSAFERVGRSLDLI